MENIATLLLDAGALVNFQNNVSIFPLLPRDRLYRKD
jgi:hypothetical protein